MTLDAGPELDARIAREVMGIDVAGMAWCWAPEGSWSVLSGSPNENGVLRPVYLSVCCCEPTDDPHFDRLFDGKHNTLCYEVVPQYSTDIAAAWGVYMEMYNKPSANRWVLVERLMGMPSATFCWNDNRPDAVAQAETMPLAICLAALAAIQGQP